MDKLLEFIVAYVKDLFSVTDKNKKINKFQISFSALLLVFLAFISFLWFLDWWNNEVLKDYAVFSFYTSIIMIIMFIIGFWWYIKWEEENNVRKFSSKISRIKDIISYEYQYKNILVLSKLKNKYEFNLWIDEKDKDFWQLYIFFPRYKTNQLREKLLNLEWSPLVLNDNFSDDSLVYKIGFEDNDLDDKWDKIIKKINDIKDIIEKNLD